jgi:hypothetical protein
MRFNYSKTKSIVSLSSKKFGENLHRFNQNYPYFKDVFYVLFQIITQKNLEKLIIYFIRHFVQ